ncbi:hypothetical protein KFK09_028748 [Dendrobium nobile]|uniref:Phosphoglucomutase n=1 Tax=Dendrobium nobile TaxID=94219 RepID=A0A8T3A449_DENNO|nr:hypothetical protein KFK09_028748 [Dendrobium nobile]
MATPATSQSPTSLILNPKPTTTLSSSAPHRLLWPRTIRRSSNASFAAAAAARAPVVPTNEIEEEASGDFIRRLQNGPDVRGVAVEGEKDRKVELTALVVEAIAECFGEWVAERRGGNGSSVRVSVGRDPRVSGRVLSAAVFAGLRKGKCEVFDMGLATTPACFMSTVLSPFVFDASIMLTASHLPYTRNGLKFFTKEGGLRSGDVEQICDRAARKFALKKMGLDSSGGAPLPPTTRVDFMSAYAKHLRDTIIERISHPSHYNTPLRGFKIIVNAGNGSGGFFTWDVLEKLGADTTGSLNLEPDGMFPNHIPNPEDPTAMSLTVAAVLRHGADLGVVFDTDVDRSGVVDRTGAIRPGTTVVTDARTSVSLTRFITAVGGRHCLYRVGYRNVIDKGVQLNEDGVETHLMMETTGHGALKENYFLDDGAYMVVKIIIEMVRMRLAGSSKGIGSLIKDLEDPIESVELRMDVVAQPKYAKEKGAEAVEAFRKCVEEGKLEGWELDTCGDCWVSDGCLVDSNDEPADVDARMYRFLMNYMVRYGWVHMRQSVHNPNIALQYAIFSCWRFLLACGLEKMLDIKEVDNFARKGKSA